MSTSNLNSDFSKSVNVQPYSRLKFVNTILLICLLLAGIAITYLLVIRNNYTLQDNSDCSKVCCSEVHYNSISEGSLDSMICNYRNKEWWKTSNFFQGAESFDYDSWKQRIANRNNASPNSPVTQYDSSYNSRYMDIDFNSLENYLCSIKRNCGGDAEFVRFYFIRYGDQCFNPAFANKHSLAIIPVNKALEEIPNANTCNSGNDSKSFIFVSNIANHNEICPPEPPIGCSKRLTNLDSDPRTY
jgi:hypothetical protein